ncbi:MAG: hypothetical protein K0S88_2118 [Actinomycetia bacterium]|jgi:hypothetical protein|nr:hypothetical protein [Actinomycetes bacterium]
MSQLITATATRPPALRGRDETDQVDRRAERRRGRLWTLIEALAYAGAYIDPSGILAVERLRRAQEEEEERHARQ